jgi:hypothetical protein
MASEIRFVSDERGDTTAVIVPIHRPDIRRYAVSRWDSISCHRAIGTITAVVSPRSSETNWISLAIDFNVLLQSPAKRVGSPPG